MMNTEKQERLNNALNIVGDILLEAADEIVSELELRDEFRPDSGKQMFTLRRGNKGRVSKGLLTHKNDFRNYVWITVIDKADENRQWVIDLFHNDIDGGRPMATNSGNLHSQFGRIQFWKGVTKKEGCCDSPHELISMDGDDITHKFCGNKGFDPGQAIYDGTYDPKTLVDVFLYEFVGRNC